MKNQPNALSPSYQSTLDALRDEDLGLALILARNGLKEAEAKNDILNLCSHQALFAAIHLQDDDKDSARRALKLMKLHSAHLSGTEKEWAEGEYNRLSMQHGSMP